MKTLLVITLMFAGQPPEQTYQAVFDKRSDCYRALAAFNYAYSTAYSIQPDDGSPLSLLPGRHPHVMRADCVSDSDDLLQS